MDDVVKFEIEMVPLGDGMEHPLDYFSDDLIRLFENFGWKVVWTSHTGDIVSADEE